MALFEYNTPEDLKRFDEEYKWYLDRRGIMSTDSMDYETEETFTMESSFCEEHPEAEGISLRSGDDLVCPECVFEPKNYELDPETEDLLFDGSFLRDGMVVMVERPSIRIRNTKRDLIGFGCLEEAKKYNRWCRVEDVYLHDDETVSFIGVYEDGTKRKFRVDSSHAWFVKKDSILVDSKREQGEKAGEELEKKYDNVLEIVKYAMNEQRLFVLNLVDTHVAVECSRKIMEVFTQ